MRRTGGAALFFGLSLALAALAAVELAKGGFYISKHEGDTLHLLDILFRMAEGQRIHRDFMTPLGVLSVAPFALLVEAGLPAGRALIGGQILVAVLLLPLIAWTCASRLPRPAAWLLGLYLVLLCVALTYGETDPSISMSMSYNRWAWALACLALLPALLPLADRRGQAMDGAVIGLTLALLVLLKITYFMALALPVLLALLLRRSWRTLGAAALAGLAVAAAATLAGGFGYWAAYLADLRLAAASPVRGWPGEEPANLMGGPAFLGLNLLLLLAVVLLRQSGRRTEGLLLLLLLPAFVYIVAQNYGNDPQWLPWLVAVLAALLPPEGLRNGRGWNLRLLMQMGIAAGLAFAAPSLANLLYSAGRHLSAGSADYRPILPGRAAAEDLRMLALRYARTDVTRPLETGDNGLAGFSGDAERAKQAVTVNGGALPVCELNAGLGAWHEAVARDLEAAGYAGKAIWQADVLEPLWLYGDFRPVRGAAPWYYGGTAGLADADFVLIPDCPMLPRARKAAVEAIAAAGLALTEVRRAPLYRLYTVAPR